MSGTLRLFLFFVAPAVAAVVAMAASSVAPLAGCGLCMCDRGNQQPVLHLSCSSTDLVRVELSGVCASDAGTAPNQYLVGPPGQISFGAAQSGAFHFELTFGTGFVYAGDVQFQDENQPCGCAPVVAPTQTDFQVNNPSNTCDAGGDL